jgi:zeta-carotene desaturase
MRVVVLGGGVAGMAAACALGSAGIATEVFEAKPFPGGRAASYARLPSDPESPEIDNCQHILMRCCRNLIDFYERLGVAGKVDFYRDFTFLERNGRRSRMGRGMLPAPLHFSEAFARMPFLSLGDKAALGRAMMAIGRERKRADLDRLTMREWLREQRQTEAAVERFWRPVLVSAVNEDLEVMSASQALQVMWLGFLSSSNAYEMGVPRVTLGTLYRSAEWAKLPVRFHLRATVERIEPGAIVVQGRRIEARAIVSALPFERVEALLPDLGVAWEHFTHSPIVGVHFWFDGPVTDLPHAALVDSPLQWFFAVDGGRYLKLVISAARQMTKDSREEVIQMCLDELRAYLPAARGMRLVDAQVVKEARATFSAIPGLERHRPRTKTAVPGLYLAGDWTATGWPATMEGAARSGYLAAEAVCEQLGSPQRFFLPDPA